VQNETSTRLAATLGQIDEWVQPSGVKGCGIAVYHHGVLAAERYAGEARPEVPVTADTLFGLASVTKPVAATSVLAAAEDGFLSLDEPVHRHLPEFAEGDWGRAEAESRATVTYRQLLSHQGGRGEDLGASRESLPSVPSMAELTAAHLREPAGNEPGTLIRYSNTGFAILAVAVERAVGESFWRYVRRRVLIDPNFDDIVIRPADGQIDRLVTLSDAANAGTPIESYNSAWWREMALPWGGAYGTPRALARFAATFLSRDAPALGLSWASRHEMVRDQTAGRPGGVGSGRVWWDEAAWGLGWEVKGTKRRHWSGELTSPETFCHFGQAGTLVWADPRLDLAVAVFTNRSVAKMWGFILSRWLRLGNALAAAV
jgi:beta-lactamase class C